MEAKSFGPTSKKRWSEERVSSSPGGELLERKQCFLSYFSARGQ